MIGAFDSKKYESGFFVGNIVLVLSVLSVPLLFQGDGIAMMSGAFPALVILIVVAAIGIIVRHPHIHGILVTVAIVTQVLGIGNAIFSVS